MSSVGLRSLKRGGRSWQQHRQMSETALSQGPTPGVPERVKVLEAEVKELKKAIASLQAQHTVTPDRLEQMRAIAAMIAPSPSDDLTLPIDVILAACEDE